jgi:hypothetical protein
MSGRGDNNKHGSSGRGMTNQSNQPLGENDSKEKSNHGTQKTGGSASEPQKKQTDQSAHRNSGSAGRRT